MVVGVSPISEPVDPILIEAFNIVPIPSPLLHTNLSHAHVFYASLGDFRWYDHSLDPHCVYLADTLGGIMFPHFFYHFIDFPKVIIEFKKALLAFTIFLLVFSSLHHS